MNLEGKRCLITGAASGIGRATAELFCQKGARVILADIRQEKVDSFSEELRRAGNDALSYAVDVSQLDPMLGFQDWVQRMVGEVDVLVNNAGVLCVGGFDETSFEEYQQVLDVNLWGVLHATKLFAPAMVQRGSGAIVNVASASGEVGFSRLTAYSTSKFAVVGFSQALRAELSKSGVSVSTVCPALVRTNIGDNAPLSEAEKLLIEQALSKRGIEAEVVAEAIVSAAKNGHGLVNVGRDAKALSLLSRIAPNAASTWLARLADREGSRW